MDFVPLTVFFMAYLLNFQENAMGKPAVANYEISVPEECEEQLNSKNYCTSRPDDYPSDDYLRQLYNNIDKLDFRFEIKETRDRVGENICPRSRPYHVSNIYLIRDINRTIRYALHIPGVFSMTIPTDDCHKDANTLLPPWYRAIKCEQETIQYPFIVLSHDKKSLESVKILGVNSACVPIKY